MTEGAALFAIHVFRGYNLTYRHSIRIIMSLNLSQLQQQLGSVYTVQYHPETTSTNDLALALARGGAPAGTVVCTDFQTAGRGRRGAVWCAPAETSVLCSVILRPQVKQPPHHLAILTGVGAAEGLHSLEISAKIKWPNDLMLAERKVGGILVETTGDAVVVGMGINCQVPQEAFPEEVQARAGSLHTLCEREIDREAVLASVIRGVGEALARVEAGGILKVLASWNTHNWLARRNVRVTGPLGSVEGDGLFLDGRRIVFHVFKDFATIEMPLSSHVEAR